MFGKIRSTGALLCNLLIFSESFVLGLDVCLSFFVARVVFYCVGVVF